MKRWRLLATAAVLLGVSACSPTTDAEEPTTEPVEIESTAAEQPEEPTPTESEEPEPAEEEAPQPATGTLDASHITAVVEELGYECEPTDRHLDIVSQSIQCRGEDYMFLTASQLKNPEEGLQFYETTSIPTLCEQMGMSEVQWATTEDWIVVPGDDREKDFAALAQAATELGLEVHSHTCE